MKLKYQDNSFINLEKCPRSNPPPRSLIPSHKQHEQATTSFRITFRSAGYWLSRKTKDLTIMPLFVWFKKIDVTFDLKKSDLSRHLLNLWMLVYFWLLHRTTKWPANTTSVGRPGSNCNANNIFGITPICSYKVSIMPLAIRSLSKQG